MVDHACEAVGRRQGLLRVHERPERDEQLQHGVAPPRLERPRLELEPEYALRHVRVEVPWRRTAARAHVWEEPHRADAVERMCGDGEDVAADNGGRFLWLPLLWSAWI